MAEPEIIDECPNCGGEWEQTSYGVVCSECGYDPDDSEAHVPCERCGEEHPEGVLDDLLCPSCVDEEGEEGEEEGDD